VTDPWSGVGFFATLASRDGVNVESVHAKTDQERAKKNPHDDETASVARSDEPGSQAFELSDAIAQAKLSVGPAVDPYEREADAVADSVVQSIRSGGSASPGPAARRSEPAAQRIRRSAGSIGAKGGEVDADTDRAIQSSRGGGSAMPDDARSKMETAFGADFSGVRVHEDAQAADLSNRIQAKAFTVGSDVYFRDGMPDTNTSSGQHLLAHELTHTIQQGGTAQRSTSGVGRIRRAPASVQRKDAQALTNVDTFKKNARGVMVPEGQLRAGESLVILTGAKEASDAKDGAVVAATTAANDAANAVTTAAEALGKAEAELVAADGKVAASTADDKSALEAAAATAMTTRNAAKETAQNATATAATKATALDTATLAAFSSKRALRKAGMAPAASGVGPVVVGEKTYVPLRSDPDRYILSTSVITHATAAPDDGQIARDGVDMANAFVSSGGVTGDIGGAKQNMWSKNDLIADSGTAKGLTQTGNAVKMGSSILTLAAGILRIKKAAASEETGAWAEGAQGVAEIGQAATATGSAIASTVDQAGDLSKNLKDANVANASTAAGKTAAKEAHTLSDAGKAASALGGFADVFAGIKSTFALVKNAIDIYKKNKEPGSLSSRSKHDKFKEAMGIITNILEMAASGVSAAKNFLDAFSTGAGPALGAAVPGFGIALGAAELIVRGVAGIKATVQSSRMGTDKRATKTSYDPKDEPAVKAMFPGGSSVVGQKGKKWPLFQKYKELSRKQDKDENSLDEKESDFVNWADTSPEIQAYALNKGMQYINKKRGRRAVLKIGIAMTKIAGDITTLGGVSAPVGIGLKAGAALADVGATAFRIFKQWARNKADGTDEGSLARKVFNTNKTSTKKLAGYNKDVDRIFDQIVQLANTPNLSDAQKEIWTGQKDRIDRVFHAIGVHPDRMDALKDQPGKLRDDLIENMQKRE
jgi:hypothetical protein